MINFRISLNYFFLKFEKIYSDSKVLSYWMSVSEFCLIPFTNQSHIAYPLVASSMMKYNQAENLTKKEKHFIRLYISLKLCLCQFVDSVIFFFKYWISYEIYLYILRFLNFDNWKRYMKIDESDERKKMSDF